MTITYRLYCPPDLEQVLVLVNGIFQAEMGNPPVPPEVWARLETGDHATVVAEEQGRVVGAIPFDIRPFRLRPGLDIRAAFAHCVGVAEGHRDRGIGSGLMDCAKRELRALCDGLFVYTGGEGHAPYTFYQRNGFVNLHYMRTYSLPAAPGPIPADVQVAPLDPATLDGAALDSVYQAVYGGYGGSPPRGPGYWQRAFASIIYVQWPHDLYLAQAGHGGRLAGYAILGAYRGKLAILELAVAPGAGGAGERLLRAAVATAAALAVSPVFMPASSFHPALPDLLKLGFQPTARAEADVLAGQVLDFDALWHKLAGAGSAPALRLWTPERQLDLPGGGPALTLEMKEATLHRLFLCREDVVAAWQAERITAPLWPVPLARLGEFFRPAPWIYHQIDFI